MNLVKNEKEGIASDDTLRKKFEVIEKLLYKNVSVKNFNAFIADHEDILSALANLANFREQVWKSYFVKHRDAFDQLVREIRAADERRKEIEEAARNEQTAWQEVINIFNDRFFVPFELRVKNFVSVVLDREKIPKLGFTFKEQEDRKDVEKDALLEVLRRRGAQSFLRLEYHLRDPSSGKGRPENPCHCGRHCRFPSTTRTNMRSFNT